jgi:hypothetical protein
VDEVESSSAHAEVSQDVKTPSLKHLAAQMGYNDENYLLA